jgi:hypothetical protein
MEDADDGGYLLGGMFVEPLTDAEMETLVRET